MKSLVSTEEEDSNQPEDTEKARKKVSAQKAHADLGRVHLGIQTRKLKSNLSLSKFTDWVQTQDKRWLRRLREAEGKRLEGKQGKTFEEHGYTLGTHR